MKRFFVIMFLLSVIALMAGGCSYYYPVGYEPTYHPVNAGFVAPYYHYSPFGYYTNYPYPYAFTSDYDEYYPPSERIYLGERPEGYKERHFEPGERSGGRESQ